jgi:hypothetical protein
MGKVILSVGEAQEKSAEEVLERMKVLIGRRHQGIICRGYSDKWWEKNWDLWTFW